jgi:hypothetical protein
LKNIGVHLRPSAALPRPCYTVTTTLLGPFS